MVKKYDYIVNSKNGDLIKISNKSLNKLLSRKKVFWNINYECYVFDNKDKDFINEFINKKINSNIFLIPLLIIIIILNSGDINTQINNINIFKKYYTKESAIIFRSSKNTDDHIYKGMIYYNNKNYNKAINEFNYNNNIMSKLFSGLSYMELKKYNKAINNFKSIIDHGDNLFIDQAEWNLALCYIITNNIYDAKKILKKISKGNTTYNIKAEQILNNLNKIN